MVFRIGVDLGGADRAPLDLYSHLFKECSDIALRLYVPEGNRITPSSSHQVMYTSQEIRMDDLPLQAIRKKKDSTLLRGLQDLQEGAIQAFVSLANTGALVLASVKVLGKFSGLRCPALVAHFPSPSHEVALLDLGAYPKNTPERLKELMLLAHCYAHVRLQLPSPRIGLLNIGHEAVKGTDLLRQVDAQMKQTREYVGFVEPVDIFTGTIDVAVTDGFTGNVLLKTAEGVHEFLKVSRTSSPMPQKAGLLLGVSGDVYKCHGRTTSAQLAQVILRLHSSQKILFPLFQQAFVSAL